MNINKSQARSFLDKIQQARGHYNKIAAELEKTKAAAEKFRKQLLDLGELDYADDSAIEKQALLKTKLTLAEKAIAGREAELAEQTLGEIREMVQPLAQFLEKMLREALMVRVQTVAAVFRPFFRTALDTERMAEKTDAVRSGYLKIDGFLFRWKQLPACEDAAPLLSFFSEAEAILNEAIKDRPNLQEWMRFEPAVGTSSAQ